MKRIFTKTLFAAFVAVFAGLLTGCNPKEEVKQFSVDFKNAGPGYITLMATVPSTTTVAYTVSEVELPTLKPEILNMTGTKVTFYKDGEQQLLDYPIDENKQYYVYLVGILGEDFSKMYTFQFSTGEFVFDQLATVVGVMPDGYKMHIKVPSTVKKSEEGKPGSRAIRYTQGDLMMYNFYKSQNDDYFNLLYNAGRYITEDTTIEYADRLNWGEAGADVNEDGVVDENDMSILWNPIAPGEPVVFVAGEFEWMSEPDEYKKGGEKENFSYMKNGFAFPGGWEDGYYLPCIDSVKYWSNYKDSKAVTKGAGIITDINLDSPIDASWTGEFSRKIFRTRIPAELKADFDVRVSDLRSVDATITIYPDSNIYRYLFTVLDDGAYNQMLELLDGKTEYLQWAVTSYFAMYNFGQIQVVAEAGTTSAPPIEFALTDFFYDVPSDTKYHVLITGMEGEIGSPQCFKHFTFSTPSKIKTRGPNVVVTALPELSTPYEAAFNVRCTSVTDNPVERAYYGANYKTEWVYEVNGGSSYEALAQNVQFTQDEIDIINSEEGYTMKFPTIDGETTRLVVVAFNDENLSNAIDQYEDVTAHPAVADCTTPFAKAEDTSYNELLDTDALVGDWTLTATVSDGSVAKQKIAIKRRFVAGKDYPTTLPAEVLQVYKTATKWTDDEINGYFEEFKNISKSYNNDRLRNQNKLLIEGWLDDSQGSLTYLSPWDLFKHEKISTVDVASMFARFGPKIYLHVNKDRNGKDSLSVTANKMFVSPIADWSVPFYMAGRRADQTESNTVFQYSDADGNYVGALKFPVTMSETRDTITIKPISAEGALWYPNVIGISTNTTGGQSYILEKPIISEVVLTKGWDPANDQTPASATKSVARSSAISPVGKVEFTTYKDLTEFKGIAKPVKMNGQVMTLEKVNENLERFYQEQLNNVR